MQEGSAGSAGRAGCWRICPARLFSLGDFADVGLAGLQRDQSSVAFIGDGDNSLSMRWVKLGANSSMNHASGAGGFSHPTVTTRGDKGSGVDKD
ncbi:hypothetical protein D3C76_1644500 [compost metagenome]